jgi:hypothetical protein
MKVWFTHCKKTDRFYLLRVAWVEFFFWRHLHRADRILLFAVSRLDGKSLAIHLPFGSIVFVPTRFWCRIGQRGVR